jgi:hypothetical protein
MTAECPQINHPARPAARAEHAPRPIEPPVVTPRQPI